jgi:WD40 repeat protein
VKPLRIFISSPGDVIEERDRARSVVEELRRRYAGRLDLVPVLWEDLPLQADMSFQQGIDVVLSEERAIDIAIFILWSRLGSPQNAALHRPNGSPYRSGTEREFDLMLHARTRSGGVRPNILVYTREDDASFDERLRGLSLTDKEDLIQQRKLVESFIREEFQDAETKLNIRAYHSFDRPTTFAQRLRIHLQDLIDSLVGGDLTRPVWDIAKRGSPFLGLDAFQFEHAPVFFGREDEIVAVRQLLREQARRGCAFALITGASGSGKSSLARAGVLPAVAAHEVDSEVGGWRTAIFTPAEGDGDLMLTLAGALTSASALPELRGKSDALAQLAGDLARDSEMVFRRVLRPALESGRVRKRLFVLVDQLEELFTDQRIAKEARDTFIRAIEALARSGFAWVLATVRSDFYAQCQSLSALVRMKENGGQLDLLPPGADALDRLIRQPATLAGLRFERRGDTSLADFIVRDATAHRELLPQLEYLLHQLFAERTADGLLSFASYERLGGVEGALARRADAVIAELAPPEAALDALLAALVTLSGDERQSVVRRRVPRAELERDETSRALVTALVRERLLTSSATPGGPAIVTVAHEALFRVWSHAVAWLSRNREFLRLRANIAHACGRWQSAQENISLLLPAGLPLEEAARLLSIEAGRLDSLLRRYIATSIARHQAQGARRRRRRQALAVAAAVTIVALSGLTWHATQKGREVRALLAESDSERAERLFGEGDSASAVWYLARAVASGSASSRVSARLWHALQQRSWPVPVLDARDHRQPITVVTFDSEGKRFATGTRDGQVTITSSRSGQVLNTSLTHSKPVLGARFSPDGTKLLTGCTDAVARLWDAGTAGFPLIGSCNHDSVVAGIAWSSDGNFFATGSWDHHLRVWNSSDPQVPVLTAKMKDKVHTVAFSPNDSRLVLAVAQDEARIYDRTTGTLSFSQTSVGDLNGACLSPDGSKLLCFSNEGDLVVSDLASGMQQWARLTFQAACQHAEVAPDGKSFLVATGNHLHVYSMEQPPKLIWEHDFADLVSRARFTPDKHRVITASNAGTIEVFAAADGTRLHEPITGRGVPVAFDFHPEDNRILSAWSTGEVRIHSLPLPAPLPRGSFYLGAAPVAAAMTGGAVACLAENGHGLLIETGPEGEGQVGKAVPIEMNLAVTAAAFHPRNMLVVAGGIDGRLFAKEIRRPETRIALPAFAAAVSRLAFSDAGTWLAAGSEDGYVGRWPWPIPATPNPAASRHQDKVSGLTFLEPDTRLLSAGWDGKIWLDDPGGGAGADKEIEGEALFTVGAPNGKAAIVATSKGVVWLAKAGSSNMEQVFRVAHPPSSAAISSGGVIGVGTVTGEVTLWSLRDGLKVAEISCGQERVNSVAFDHTGRWLATGTEDGSARLWEVSTGQPVTEAIKHRKAVRHVLLSDSGQDLVTIQIDGSILVWPVGVPATGRALVDLANHCLQSDRQQVHRFVPDTSVPATVKVADFNLAISSLRASGNSRLGQEADMLAAYLSAPAADSGKQ